MNRYTPSTRTILHIIAFLTIVSLGLLCVPGCGSQCADLPKGNYTAHCDSNSCGACEADSVITFDPNSPVGATDVMIAIDLCSQTFTLNNNTSEVACDDDARHCNMHTVKGTCVETYTLTFTGTN